MKQIPRAKYKLIIGRIFFILLTLLIVSCNKPPRTSKMFYLSSGREVLVYSINRIHYLKNNQISPLILTYETELAVKDSPELRAEVNEVSELLKLMKDEEVSYMIIRASEPIRGMFAKTEGFKYGFEKDDNDQWTMIIPPDK